MQPQAGFSEKKGNFQNIVHTVLYVGEIEKFLLF